jgi:hypothetical protein
MHFHCLPLCFLFISCAFAAAAAPVAPELQRLLTPDNFKPTIANGVWLVKDEYISEPLLICINLGLWNISRRIATIAEILRRLGISLWPTTQERLILGFIWHKSTAPFMVVRRLYSIYVPPTVTFCRSMRKQSCHWIPSDRSLPRRTIRRTLQGE